MDQVETIFINSRDRSPLSVSSSDFEIDLPKLFINVKSIDFVGAIIGNTIYTINNNNNKLRYIESIGLVPTTVTLTNGVYTANQLASHLSVVLTANSANLSSYTVTYDAQTFKFTFSSSLVSFMFSFTGLVNNCSYELGFVEDSNTSTASSITAPYVAKIVDTFILVETDFHNNVQTSNHSVNCSWVLELPPSGTYTGVSLVNSFQVIPPMPMPSFRKIKIRLKNCKNKTVDFNGGDFVLMFDVKYSKK